MPGLRRRRRGPGGAAVYRKTCRTCARWCAASTSRWATARGAGGACRAGTPLQTSDALGAAGVQPGPNVAALTAELHTEPGLPPDKTARVLETRFGLRVTKSGLVRLLHRTAGIRTRRDRSTVT